MTAPINTINDNDVLFGSIPLAITNPGGSSVSYETNDFNIEPKVEMYVRKSSKNIGNGRVVNLVETSGTATLMFPASTSTVPIFGASFTATPNPAAGSPIAYTCTITKVGEKLVKAGEALCSIEFNVNFGTVVTSTAT